MLSYQEGCNAKMAKKFMVAVHGESVPCYTAMVRCAKADSNTKIIAVWRTV